MPRAIIAGALALVGGLAHADGTETLGPPSIPLSGGSGFAVGGVGLSEEIGEFQFVNLDGDIVVNVPTDAVVKQVILYWVGEFYPQSGGDSFATVNGLPVVGQPIGGPTNFFSVVWFEAYRVDITGLGLVAPGTNVLTIADLNFSYRNTGAGVLVVYDNGKGADLQLLDGLDLAYWRLAPPLDAIVPQTFYFEPAPVARQAHIPLQVASVGNDRPNITEVTVGGETQQYYDLFTSLDGPEWDSVLLPVSIPAGADELTIGLYSADGLNSGKNPASLGWVAGGLAIEDPETPEEPCGPCDGKVSQLTLRYDGSTANANIKVTYRDGSNTKTAFSGVVQPGQSFSFVGGDKQGTLGPEISVSINGTLNTKIHTSCSVPIGPGQVHGAFTILAGASRNGGNLCPLNGGTPPTDPPVASCKPCDGKVTNLTLSYQGTRANARVVVQEKAAGPGTGNTVFDGTLQPGGQFSFAGRDRQGTLGTEISIFVNGQLNAKIHTSCSTPIGPGLVAGDFQVVSGASRNGGILCPINGGTPPTNPPGGGETDEYCETGKPVSLKFRYTGDSCEASNNQQSSKNFSCEGSPQGAGQVRIVASDHNRPQQARVFFDGLVSLNESFDVSAEAVGLARMKANLYVSVYSASGNQLLQTLKIHVSCSDPLNAGDQFGSLKLVGYGSDRGVVSVASDVELLPETLPAFGCGAADGPASRAALGDALVVALMATLLGAFALRRAGQCA